MGDIFNKSKALKGLFSPDAFKHVCIVMLTVEKDKWFVEDMTGNLPQLAPSIYRRLTYLRQEVQNLRGFLFIATLFSFCVFV